MRTQQAYVVFMTILFLSIMGKSLAQTPTAAVKAISQTENTLKSALVVTKEEEGVAFLTAPLNTSFSNGTKILFVRKRGPRLDPIAQGQVIGEFVHPTTKVVSIKVEINRDAILKYPQTGDHAVLLANEISSGTPDPKENIDVPELAEKKKKSGYLPGYFEGGAGLLFSASIEATPSTNANVAKLTSGYRFMNTHFAYYSDFYPIGLEVDSHSGSFPTRDYQTRIISSEESVKVMSFNYRFEPLVNKKIFPRLRLLTLNDSFKTSNTDENLLTTTVSGLGAGTRFDYEFAGPLWKPGKGDSFFKLQAIQAEFNYFFSLKPEDIGISRGTKELSSGTGMLYGVQATALVWLDFVPWFKRWVVQAGYRTRSYNLKFAGTTVSEVGNPYQIPQNGTSSEKETDMRFFVGLRIEDPIRLIFPDKDKQGDKK